MGLDQHPQWKWLGAVAVLVMFMLAGTASEKLSQATRTLSTILSKVLLYALGLLGPAILFGAYLVLCVLQITSPVVDPDRDNHVRIVATLDAAAVQKTPVKIGQTLIGEFQKKGIYLSDRATVTKQARIIWFRDTPLEIKIRHDQWVIEDAANGRRYTLRKEPKDDGHELTLYPGWRSIVDGWGDVLYMGVGLLVFFLNWFLLDVNVSASHGFFRDRLSRAYLIREDGNDEEAIAFTDDQKLSSLNAEGTKAPYHLVNVTLNLNGSKDPNVRGRNADFL